MENKKPKKKITMKTPATQTILRGYFKDIPPRITKKYINNILGYNGSKSQLFKYFNTIFQDIEGMTPKTYYKTTKSSFAYDSNTKEIGRLNNNTTPLIYQEFGINKTTLPVKNTTNNNIKFIDIIPNDIEIQLTKDWECELFWSGDENDEKDWYSKSGTFTDNTPSKNIMNQTTIKIKNEFSNPTIRNLTIECRSVLTNQTFKLENMELRDRNPINICNIFNEVIENKCGSCIQQYMSKYNRLLERDKKGRTKELVNKLKTTKDVHDFCVLKKIKMIAYDIQGNIIMRHKPEKKNKNGGACVFVAYNNHLYPLKNQTLSKVSNNNTTPKYVDDICIEFKKIIELGFLPSNLFMIGTNIKSFIHKGYSYHSNKEYDICLDILTKYGIEEQMTPLTNLKTIGNMIADLYIKDNIKSFIPENNKFIKGGYNWNNPDVLCDNTEEFITIDQVKCYSSILSNLNYLIKYDVKKHRRYDFKQDHVIIDHYLYIVKPKYSSQLLPSQNIYTGEHIKLCKRKGVEFKILEVQETLKVKNYYKQMIIDLYQKVDNWIFKDIINIMIGKMEGSCGKTTNFKVSKIVNKDELETVENGLTPYEIYDGLYALKEPVIKYNLYTLKPISIQIKDMARVKNFCMAEDLGLNFNTIKQIKTDSITFKHDVNKNRDYLKYIKNELNNWKLEEYCPQKSLPTVNNNMTFKYDKGYEKNIFGDCYAGCGKSHKIINHYLKDDSIKNDYIILTPSHSTAKQYRKLGHNAHVIQKYQIQGKIPNEKNIIVDEIGMVDNCGWGVLYKCKLENKRLIGYGDRNQLLPIGTEKDYFSENWISYMFGTLDYMITNYRNNFNKDYYNYLINNTNSEKLAEEIKKYSTDKYYDADIILAYRNDTRRHYNKLMCDRLGIKNKFDIGAKIICKTNDFSNIGLYNNFDCVVQSNCGKIVSLYDGETIFKIPIEDFLSKSNGSYLFDYGYARTLHSVQGESLNSFYYPEEDLIWSWINGRMAYTLISRLKTK